MDIKRIIALFAIISSMALLGWQYIELGKTSESYYYPFMSECAIDLTQTHHCQLLIESPHAGMNYWICVSWPGTSMRTLANGQLDAIQTHTRVTFQVEAGQTTDVIATDDVEFDLGYGRISISGIAINTSDSVIVDVEFMDGFDWPNSAVVSITYSSIEIKERNLNASLIDGTVQPIVLILEVILGVILLTLFWKIINKK